MIMKKQYLEPAISVMMVESQPMMAASDPANYDSTPSKDAVKGSQVTSNTFNFLGEEGEI